MCIYTGRRKSCYDKTTTLFTKQVGGKVVTTKRQLCSRNRSAEKLLRQINNFVHVTGRRKSCYDKSTTLFTKATTLFTKQVGGIVVYICCVYIYI